MNFKFWLTYIDSVHYLNFSKYFFGFKILSRENVEMYQERQKYL